ncbi:MAG TPA: protein CapI [Parachlamydiales bacterium]|nr:MAG: protein CapI [Chlamydiae bacterium GWA2_50_15]OGN71128.1 MAG: protein CapI [Chlamydiae bacterium RIFCSPLOWO2_02_FULL_49_12]HAZ15256.1 protein CapI [Parachlamydiales bacterium]
MNSNKRIFITGIAGFVGFHLARHLKRRGDAVCGLDNFNSYYDPLLKRERAALLKEEGILVFEGDVCDQTRLLDLFNRYNPSHLVHLAAQAGVRYSLTHPDAYLQSNLSGMVHLLEACRTRADMELIFASSSSVYGLNRKIPFSESDPTDHPSNLYGASKKAGEMLAFSYHHLFGIPLRILRFFTVYGPWGRPDMAYFSFTKAILENRPIPLFHNGQMRRDFTYIDDIVRGIAAAVDLNAPFEIFNLGNEKPESVATLVNLLEKKLGKKALVTPLPKQVEEVETTFADISKAKKELAFHPMTSLSEGLDHFLKWYLSNCSYTQVDSRSGFGPRQSPAVGLS